MKNRIYFLLMLLFLIIVPVTMAKETPNTAGISLKEQNEINKANIQEKKGQIAEERCLNLQKKIKARNENIVDKAEQYLKKFENLETKIDGVIEKLKNAGCETTDLSEDLRAVKESVIAFRVRIENYKNIATQVEGNICDEVKSNGYKATVEKLKNEIQFFREDSLKIRNSYKRSFLTHFKKVRNQCRELNQIQNTTESSEIKNEE